MLINYEYEILSYMAAKSINKTDKNLVISFNKIKDIDDNIDKYLKLLQQNNIVSKIDNKININTEIWIDIFIRLLEKEFEKNSMDVKCTFEKNKFGINFNTNGVSKFFKIIFINNLEDNEYEDKIFMSPLSSYENKIYWIDLLNDINTLHMFYSYLINEINRINIYEYKEINVFEGVEETYISEIFNISIKNYFKKKNMAIKEVDIENKKIIRNILCKDELNCYCVDFEGNNLFLVKDKNIIKFLTIKNSKLIYIKDIDNTIIDIRDKLIKKISEYRNLMMFKDNKIIDNSIKLTNNATKLFVPLSIAFSIFNIFNISSEINIEYLKAYRKIAIALIVILIIIQVYIVYLVYIPSFKLSKFKWEI